MKKYLWAWDLVDSLRFGSSTTVRWLLALASTLHGVLIILSGADDRPLWAAIFLTDAFALWWRIIDATPRIAWAYAINISTAALWASVTYGFVVTATPAAMPLPVLTGYVILTLMALLSAMRTEVTRRDRGSA